MKWTAHKNTYHNLAFYFRVPSTWTRYEWSSAWKHEHRVLYATPCLWARIRPSVRPTTNCKGGVWSPKPSCNIISMSFNYCRLNSFHFKKMYSFRLHENVILCMYICFEINEIVCLVRNRLWHNKAMRDTHLRGKKKYDVCEGVGSLLIRKQFSFRN